jgi:uridine phosphorylase
MSIPNVPEKIDSEALFRPADFLAYLGRIGLAASHRPAPDAVILSYQKSLFEHVLETYPCERAKGYFGRFIHYVDLPGSPRSIAIAADFGVGAPAAAVALEELIAWGVKEFISMGLAGSLSEDLPPGSLVVCDGAFRDEGTSYHYIEEDVPACPDAALTGRLEAALRDAGLSYAKGPTWTTDAIYRETPLEVRRFRERGALVVEMEAAALFAVAQYRRVPLASCFSVSDTLAYLEWRPDFHAEPTVQGLETLFSCAVRALQ